MRRARHGANGTPLSTRVLDARTSDVQELLAAFMASIDRGGIVALPTDTVYGLACDPTRPEAIARIFSLKDRPAEKPLTLLLASVDELIEYLEDAHSLAALAARAFLPGALTIIAARPSYVDPAMTAGLDTLGMRVPDDHLAVTLLDRSGPLASTSLNISGMAAYIGEGPPPLRDVDLFIDAGLTARGRESTVVDFTVSPPKLLREGALSRAAFDAWLKSVEA